MQFLKDIFHLFFPNVCLSCKDILSNNQNCICLNCRHDLPETNFTNTQNNLIENLFRGRVQIVAATSLFFFHKKGKVQQIIHQLKYKGHQEIGTLLGGWLANDLKDNIRFKHIDCIVPVPIHPKKYKKRGYNQLTTFGNALSEILEIPFIEHDLIKRETAETQTHKGRVDRWENVKASFMIKDKSVFKEKHVLLIDDVITTGATIEACAQQILLSENAKISVAVLAYTE